MDAAFVISWILLFIVIDGNYGKQLPPVILVPGDGGTRIEGKLDKPSHGPHVTCTKVTKHFYTMWVRIFSVLTPEATDCFISNFRLIYNNKTHTTSYPDGVDIRVTGFGDTESVEWLTDFHISKKLVGYYAMIVQNMVKWGYVRNKTVRGAPYDFRKAPNEMSGYYSQLTKLVEDTYTINNNSKVVLLGHSLGNLVLLYFLNQKPQEWKDKFIGSFVTLSAPWGGSVKTIKMQASGDDMNIATVKALRARSVQRSMPSSAFLLPSDQFWNKTEVLIQTPTRNYTVNDYKQFFTDINFPDGYFMRKDTENLIDPMKPPNVQVHCLYSSGLLTAKTLVYTKDEWPDKQPTPINEDGDHTVSLRSLEGCLRWKTLQKQPIDSKQFHGIKHLDMLKEDVVIDYIKSILIK
ncbi:lysosomal phospholipase A and acyltransferase-like isoform X1 [Mytilus edulis]|uniref:lysosomal phospholipase A and acyltransferase-like isoform X1 n=1 Tax=Mytilus edulis TaxID=6550 RepID=UPI0039EEBB68